MANREDMTLMAHLMRRAGFGATREELESLVERGYEETVEQLLHPQEQPAVDDLLLYRYHPEAEMAGGQASWGLEWLYRMVNTKCPLQEKIALLWHQVFATGNSKVESAPDAWQQIQLFQEHGMGNYRDLLVRLAKDPAMIIWLDNSENHKRAPNENWGRELLELFSLGVGNYTEKDVFECSRAFTGWTVERSIPGHPYGWFQMKFEFRPEDHDYGEKTFLGHTGNFNGEDIIDIIVQQPACHRFISRHLYNFLVADESQVPAWPTEPPRDPEAIKLLSETFANSDYEIRPVLRTLFNSDFFKEAMYQKVRSPAEVVAGTIRLTRKLQGPDPGWGWITMEPQYMGQKFLDPPSVEGWHTGKEWMNSGSLVGRVNFMADCFSNTDLPGVQDIIKSVASNGPTIKAQTLVDRCLDLMGPLEVAENTRSELVAQAASEGPVSWATDEEYSSASRRVAEVLALISGTREYQFG